MKSLIYESPQAAYTQTHQTDRVPDGARPWWATVPYGEMTQAALAQLPRMSASRESRQVGLKLNVVGGVC